MSTVLQFTSFEELGTYLQKETEWLKTEAVPAASKPTEVRQLPARFNMPWPNGTPITGIEVNHHVVERYLMRNFDVEDDATEEQIKNKIATGIMQRGHFVRTLPGKDVWVVGFEGEYVAALRDADGKMIVLSYYGTREQMSWYYQQEVLVREKRKTRAAV